MLIGAAFGADAFGCLQLGLSVLVWGVFVRTVLVWHITWSVNSVTHIWGYRNYETDEQSTNNFVVALLSGGEGWHNNHHADPRSARHGHHWWEIDTVYWMICILALLGLASDVAEPNQHRLVSKKRLVTRTPTTAD
jgi:stearoyl-CoA desaturase (delta-9 desaturase)